MNKQDCRKTAKWFLVLSHPARLQILSELLEADRCVCELQVSLRKPQPYISQQLRVLRTCGMIECRKVGQFRYYCLTDPLVKQVLRLVQGQAGQPGDRAAPSTQSTFLESI